MFKNLVFDAILTSRQTREKLQSLYENLMSNNFRKVAVLKKIWIANSSYTPKESTEKKLRALRALKDLEPLLKIFYTFLCKKVPGKMYGKCEASFWRNLSTGTPQKVFSTILCFVALVYKSYFFLQNTGALNEDIVQNHLNIP